jgi:hypothetical protein
MIAEHGNVISRKARRHPAYSRYVALLDVLGMKDWLARDSAQTIAESLDEALVACDQGSSGSLDGRAYGPLIATVHFSDSLLAWSPDDSWASLATMCSAVKMIVISALDNGVPLRGAISVGEVVCNVETQRFVGNPIADAYLWSEKLRPYRSVGVDFTPATLGHVRSRLDSTPIPPQWDSERGELLRDVLDGTREASRLLAWYQGCLFVNHWAHGTFVAGDPREMFLRRGLPVSGEVEQKVRDMEAFFTATKQAERRYWDLERERWMATARNARSLEEDLAAVRAQADEEERRALERATDYLELESVAKERAGSRA